MKDFLQGKWLGHPLHAALVHIPVALWPAAAILDVLAWMNVGGSVLGPIARYCILGGLIVGVLAAAPGLADWWDIKPDKPAKRIGFYHMALNLLAITLFAANLWLRWDTAGFAGTLPMILSVIGACVVLVSGYLGGLMVYEHGISVARVSKEKWRKEAKAGGARVPGEQKG